MKDLLTLITPYHFSAILKEGLSLDHIYMLVSLQLDTAWNGELTAKQKALVQALERKFLITAEGQLTPSGEQLLEFLASPVPEVKEVRPLKPKSANDDFETWWKAFPSTDTVIEGGKILFKGSRSLKGKKDEALGLFQQVLMEGFTLEQLLSALQYEVRMRVERSKEEKKNCMKYMINSSSYLRQRIFASFIEVATLEQQQSQQPKKTAATVSI